MKTTKRLLAVLLAVTLIFVLFSCNDAPHVHTFSEDWTYDETNHWHASTCGHTAEVSDKTAHTFGETKVTKEATEDVEGEQTTTCTSCGYEKKETIVKLEHKHTFSSDWTKDETSHWHASTCGHADEVSAKAKHDFDDGRETKTATETEEGEKTYNCKSCGYEKTEKTGTLSHTHTYSKEWTSDDTHHWHASTCGHADEVSDKAAHDLGAGTVTTAPTCTESGVRTYTCVCGKTKTETIPATGHSYSTAWKSDDNSHWHEATCKDTTEVSGKATHDFGIGTITTAPTCTKSGVRTYTCICGKTKTETIDATGHSYSDTWSSDDDYHWHASTCGHTTEVSDKATHDFGTGTVTTAPTCTESGVRTYTCICGKTKTEPIEATGHKYSDKWSSDDDYHWHAATCGDTSETEDYEAHSFGEWVVDEEATEEKEGRNHRVCSTCSYKQTASIEMLNHECTSSESYAYDETYHWYKCTNSNCTKHLYESNHTLLNTTKSATCTEDGKITYWCETQCGYTKEEIIEKTGHDFTLDGGWKKEPTAFEAGIKIYKCSHSGCTETIEKEEWDDTLRHTHADLESVGGWDPARETFFYRYKDSDNYYGMNTTATCSVEGKVAAFCSCYTDEATNDGDIDETKNYYVKDGDGRARTFIGYINIGRDEDNHVKSDGQTALDTEITAVKSYFYGSYTTTMCSECNKEIGNKEYNVEGKQSAEGRWTGDVNVETYGVYLKCDISLYHNISVFKNYTEFKDQKTGEVYKGDQIELWCEIMKLNISDNINLYRTTDGRWLSTSWTTGYGSSRGSKKVKYLGFASSEFDDLALPICDEVVADTGMMESDYFGEPSLILNRQELSTSEKSVLTISGVSDLTKLTFAKDENGSIYTVTIPADSASVTLKWFTLLGNTPAYYMWSINGITQKATGDNLTLKYSEKPCTVSCTTEGETHSVIILFDKAE